MSRLPNLNIMDDAPAGNVQQADTPPGLRAFGDYPATRKAIDDNVFNVLTSLPPVANKTHTLKLTNVSWQDGDHFTKKQRKHAVLSGGTLGRRSRGTWELSDNATGNVLDKKGQVVLRVPHLTDNGTFIHNGSEYASRNQRRLRPGIYAREKANGEYESYVNVLSGGQAHRYQIDPAKGIFYTHVGQANIPLLPLLQHLGAGEQEIRDAWGDELYARNLNKADGSATGKYVEKFLHGKVPEGQTPGNALKDTFAKMQLDPEVTSRTLGHPFTGVDKHTILSATKKLLAVSRGEAEQDDRDHLAYQTFHGPEDMMAERLKKDRAGAQRQMLFKASMKGHLQNMPSSALQGQIDSMLLESGLASPLDETNPMEMLDKNTQVSGLGEGGVSSTDAIPQESRNVSPSQLGFVDILRTPESEKAGIDTYLSRSSRKGTDGKLYSRFTDLRTGKPVWKTPQDVADTVVTFPGAMSAPGKRVPAIKNGRMTYVPKKEVTLVSDHFENTFSPLGNLIPLKSMVKGQRAVMASRQTTQALPLVNAEAPLVQNAMPGTSGSRSYEQEYGKHAGALHASQGGRVISADSDHMTVKYDNGKIEKIELFNNLPHNRKTGMSQTPAVQPGQRFVPGQLLAKSTYTDNTGALALGANARVAFMPWHSNHEDAIVISESMAKRLASEHLYQHQLEVSEKTKTGRKAYVSLFPATFDKKKLATISDEGTVKPGTVVQYGDPLILAAEEHADAQNKIHRRNAPSHKDVSVTWEHSDPGVVTDVVQGKTGPMVTVKSVHPMQVGDKLAGRHGNKGVVSEILRDHEMPVASDGRPAEIVQSDLGMVSRINPSMWAEAKLGQIAEKLGHPVKVEDFDPKVPDRVAWIEQLMRQHGIKDTEDMLDPVRGTKIPNVFTGNAFFMKLSHMAEAKLQGRGGGGYSSDDSPAKGGATGSKRISLLDLSALLSAGGTETLRDAGSIRGQRNEDYWLQFMQGNTPRTPKVPMVYEKFVNELKSAGVNVVPDGSQLHIMAMTDKDIDRLAGNRNIENGESVEFHNKLKPVKGGIFDEALTGGHHGKNWSALPLAEPMPSPVMEEPTRRLLGLTKKKFEDVLAGRENLPGGGTGPSGIAKALKDINLDRELLLTRAKIQGGNKTDRDAAVRKLGYLKSAKRLGIHPGEWVLHRAPVLPPVFRPVSLMGNKNIPLVSDANFLYRELVEANNNLRDMKQHVGDENVGDERLALYHAFKAVTGLGEPITQQNQDRNVKGVIQRVLGSSPKFGTLQRKLLSSTVDNVGRAVIAPNPDLDMDQVGLPEQGAFDVYSRFIARRMHRSGMPLVIALQHIRDRSPLARKALLEEMEERPVIANRAPVLHKFGIMAFKPQLMAGSVMHMSPLVYKGFGADNDGDMMQFHVPTSEEARKEAMERLLPSRQLISPADFKTPMHVASQEYIGGLHAATHHKTKRHHTFRSTEDVRKAWARGDVSVGDLVDVLEKARS